jgi:hypothetical protein
LVESSAVRNPLFEFDVRNHFAAAIKDEAPSLPIRLWASASIAEEAATKLR